ncbi:insulin-like receptor [Bombyx mandarina]|uniref:receptor protein-tyrosine kinase n=1 Tax=Bombyx mandarina TaxID=7092 RepID=A0A6J2KHP5_BOMMA|nr:insulin-like receptor [Bombyx mandarina]
MAENLVLFLLLILSVPVRIQSAKPQSIHGVCRSVTCNSLHDVREKLSDCVVIMGSLQLSIMERTKKQDFKNISFPNLREVTHFLLVYRVQGLQSLGILFPNLARIRGEVLLNNYALIIYDMPKLKEIGLYSLLKIDRGGVIIWGLPQACYVDTVDWKIIAPRARHVISPPDKHSLRPCNVCRCSLNSSLNHCWNNMKCQRYLEGPEGEVCDKQCLGCRKTNATMCSVCRHFTYRENCLPECPNSTILLGTSKYCITAEDCHDMDGWTWNKTCIFQCPVDYVQVRKPDGETCEYCRNCHQTCESLTVQTTESIQLAERCVYINGSLTIHLGSLIEAMTELRTFLSRIEVISEYLVIYSSSAVTSLDFLSSLRRIKGNKLVGEKFSLVIHDMINLHSLFNVNVSKNLQIDHGTYQMFNNPLLCMSHIDKIKDLFPEEPAEEDVIQGTNGYGGNCEEASVDIQIQVVNETCAVVMFSPLPDPDVHYSVLYVRMPPEINKAILPETCSQLEWFAEAVPTKFGQNVIVQLTSLRPASTYAVCIETYDPVYHRLARSRILNFTTLVGIPEPPFIIESVASSYDVIVLSWVDHKDYRRLISSYELDVVLIDTQEILLRNNCKSMGDEFFDIDYTRHAVVMRPPPEYGKSCESMCGFLSTVTAGALVEDHFDVCDNTLLGCKIQKDPRPGNTSFNNYVKTLSLNITGPKNAFQIGNLAPYRDYSFRLRACFNSSCSRSTKSIVRTLRAFNHVDVPRETVATIKDSRIVVSWKPPEITNGPILAYTVELLPKIEQTSYLIPQSWCVMGNITSFEIVNLVASTNKVRVCSKTLASLNTCNDWILVTFSKPVLRSWAWWSLLFGVMLYGLSLLVGSLWRQREDRSDTVSLVEWTNN